MRVILFFPTARYFDYRYFYSLILKDFLTFYQYKTRTTGLFKMAKRAINDYLKNKLYIQT